MSPAGVALGFRLGLGRLSLRRWLALAALVVLVTAAVALVERASAPLHAPSRALGALFSIVVPLATVGIVSFGSGGDRLDAGAWSVARYGFTRGEIALGSLLLPGLGAAFLTTITAALALALAYGGRSGLVADLRVTLPIAALGGFAYFGFIALGATFFRRGHGRWVAFMLDLVLGATSGGLSIPFPRGHLRSLLGGEAVLDLSQSASSAALLGIAAAGALLAVQRSGR